MLYYDTVSPGMISLLKRVMSYQDLNLFRLVGGTSLSLQLGHRLSVDLDFFSERSFDIDQTIRLLSDEKEPFELRSISRTGFSCVIDNIKCDFYNWSVPFIKDPIYEGAIRLCSAEDIAAFKLDAIIKRKEKKDFWDIEALMNLFPLKEMLNFYKQKYLYNDIKIVMDALSEIDIADESEDPVIVKPKTWDEVKITIKKNWKDFQLDKLNEKEQEKLLRIQKAEQMLKDKRSKE